ncbi:uncharacterized protein N7506_007445 [Penicillium brevicompactum]|uniref:uncharacterized protein n=1 Tax=Penicillium brevicompactum TaxID=5074 RepID=UPI00254227A4|nr:uncharacterized protein N7506_007445 [Penicillium brevicompactum]KAJ5333662.1 hypothetical protein N7506_007445 [Penicillium brevicompactum]
MDFWNCAPSAHWNDLSSEILNTVLAKASTIGSRDLPPITPSRELGSEMGRDRVRRKRFRAGILLLQGSLNNGCQMARVGRDASTGALPFQYKICTDSDSAAAMW